MQATHLQKVSNGRLYKLTPERAQRGDMRPVTLMPDGSIQGGVVNPDLDPGSQMQVRKILERLATLDEQVKTLTAIISRMPHGQEILDARGEATAQVEPASQSTTGMAPPVSAGPTVEPADPAGVQSSEGSTEVDQLQEDIKKAVEKVDQQQRYFNDRTEIANAAREQLGEMTADLTEHNGDLNPETNKTLAQAHTDVRGAQIKEKAATTKLANATKNLAELREQLNELLEAA